MCHGLYSKVYYHWTQGSAALCMGSKSLVSFVSSLSLCCFWHVYQLVDMLGCCSFLSFRFFFLFFLNSTSISYNWPPLFLSFCLSPLSASHPQSLLCLTLSFCLSSTPFFSHSLCLHLSFSPAVLTFWSACPTTVISCVQLLSLIFSFGVFL